MPKISLNFQTQPVDGKTYDCTLTGVSPSPPPPPPPPWPVPPGVGFHVTTSGSASGDGTSGRPWDLQTALSKGLAAGSIVVLHGGTYRGAYKSTLRGTAAAPIIVRQAPGERATLDGNGFPGKTVLTVAGVYTHFIGFEVCNSQTDRNANSSPDPSHPDVPDMPLGDGIGGEQSGDAGTGCKFINMVVHDTRQNFSLWMQAKDTEIYGCVLSNAGWTAPDRGHGYSGMYSQNSTGTKVFRNNFVFWGFESGVVIYGSDAAQLNNFIIDGNTFAQCGILGHEVSRNILIGGGNQAKNCQIISNLSYYPTRGTGTTLNLGYADSGAGSDGCAVQGNTMIGGKMLAVNALNLNFRDNYLATDLAGWPAGTNNKIVSGMPTETLIFARPNAYAAGRTHLSILNGSGVASVSVQASLLGLVAGDKYEIRNVENYFATPATGTVVGTTIPVNVTPGQVAPPSGWPAPSSLRPRLAMITVQKL